MKSQGPGAFVLSGGPEITATALALSIVLGLFSDTPLLHPLQPLANSLTMMHFFLPPQIYYYADSIYATAGVKPNDIQYVTVGTGAVNVFMTIAAVGTFFTATLKSHNKETSEGGLWCSLGPDVGSHQQETMCLNRDFIAPGVHRGSLGATAAPPLWFWDLLRSLCAAHCSSQPPGTGAEFHVSTVLLCCPLVAQHTKIHPYMCLFLNLEVRVSCHGLEDLSHRRFKRQIYDLFVYFL